MDDAKLDVLTEGWFFNIWQMYTQGKRCWTAIKGWFNCVLFMGCFFGTSFVLYCPNGEQILLGQLKSRLQKEGQISSTFSVLTELMHATRNYPEVIRGVPVSNHPVRTTNQLKHPSNSYSNHQNTLVTDSIMVLNYCLDMQSHSKM